MFGGSQSALVGIRKGLPGRQEKRSGGSNPWLSVSSRPICTCGALNSRVSLEAQTAQAGRDTAELSISTSKELSRTLVCKSQNVMRVAADARVGLGVLPVPSPDGGVRVFL